MKSDLLLADGFEKAFIGIIIDHENKVHAVYDQDKALTVLVERDGMDFDEALEWLSFNVTCAYVGPHTPFWLERMTMKQLEELEDPDG